MKRIFLKWMVWLAVLLLLVQTAAASPSELIPGGSTVGLKLQTAGVMVIEVAKDCQTDLKKGDLITKINGEQIDTAQQIQQSLQSAQQPIRLTVTRNGKQLEFLAKTVASAQGASLGIYVRDSMAGIGTVTFYDPQSGVFGALGHGVNETGTAQLMPTKSGVVLSSEILSVKKGKVGTPGQLQGAAVSMQPIGNVSYNTSHGIFGTLNQGYRALPAVPVAKNDEITTGKATILSNISGTEVHEYDVEILRLYPTEKETGRNLLLHVTDPQLLDKTGGIVQGMSGSPILQNGKIIGAVTHVLVNDPTTGYGIFIENMLDACELAA